MRISLIVTLSLLPLTACTAPHGSDSDTVSGELPDSGVEDTSGPEDTAGQDTSATDDTGAEETGVTEENGGAPASLAELFAEMGPAATLYAVDGATGGVVDGSGVSLVFAPNAFVDGAGEVVTGEVTVSLTEYMTLGDMVRGGRPTVTTDGTWLETSGSFDLAASHEGEPVDIVTVASMTFDAWADASANGSDGMELWVTKEEGAAWERPLPEPLGGRTVDSSEGLATQFQTAFWSGIGDYPSFNCDAIALLSSSHTTLVVEFLSHFTTESGVFFLPENQNTAVRLYNGDAAIPGYYSYQNTMPVGVTGKLVVYSLIDGDYYLYHDDSYVIPAGIDVGAGVMEEVVAVDPVLVSEATFHAYIDAL